MAAPSFSHSTTTRRCGKPHFIRMRLPADGRCLVFWTAPAFYPLLRGVCCGARSTVPLPRFFWEVLSIKGWRRRLGERHFRGKSNVLRDFSGVHVVVLCG